MQINVPPGARVIIETQDAAPLTLSNPPERPRNNIALIAAAAFGVGLLIPSIVLKLKSADTIPVQAANQSPPLLTLPSQPPKFPTPPPAPQANPFGLKP